MDSNYFPMKGGVNPQIPPHAARPPAPTGSGDDIYHKWLAERAIEVGIELNQFGKDPLIRIAELEAKVNNAYHAGYEDGLKCFAWWKDGVQFVGTCGTTLEYALDNSRLLHNYNFNISQELEGS